MARKIFFSFHYARDSWRVQNVRQSASIANFDKTPFYDKATWEKIKLGGDDAIKNWINDQLKGTSATVVLIGAETYKRRWVKYEIQRTLDDKRGLIGVYIGGIKDQNGDTEDLGPNPLPDGYPTYRWNKNNGAQNLGEWVEKAAVAAGR